MRLMCTLSSLTSVASSANAWAAIATSKSSRRTPRCSRSALAAPNARLTASVQAARDNSPRNTRKRSRNRSRRFDFRMRARPYSTSAITGCGSSTSVRASARIPAADLRLTGPLHTTMYSYPARTSHAGGPLRVRPTATAARRSSQCAAPLVIGARCRKLTDETGAPTGLGGHGARQRAHDVAIAAHGQILRAAVHRRQQVRGKMHGRAHVEQNMNIFDPRQSRGGARARPRAGGGPRTELQRNFARRLLESAFVSKEDRSDADHLESPSVAGVHFGGSRGAAAGGTGGGGCRRRGDVQQGRRAAHAALVRNLPSSQLDRADGAADLRRGSGPGRATSRTRSPVPTTIPTGCRRGSSRRTSASRTSGRHLPQPGRGGDHRRLGRRRRRARRPGRPAAAIEWPDGKDWSFGEPDLVISSPDHVLEAVAADWYGLLDGSQTGLTEDRWVKAVEVREVLLDEAIVERKSGDLNLFVVHHAVISARERSEEIQTQSRPTGERGPNDLSWSCTKWAERHPLSRCARRPAAGRLGAQLGPAPALHRRRGAVPHRRRVQVPPGGLGAEVQGSRRHDQLPDLRHRHPAGGAEREDGRHAAGDAAGIMMTFEPHLHSSGKRMCIEAIYPTA